MIFNCAAASEWSRTHAQLPTPVLLGDTIRVFYSTRDKENRSATGFFDVSAGDPSRVINVHPHPVLAAGPAGRFDDCGAMGSSAVRVGDKIYLYYQGWNVRTTVPFHTAIGMAISYDGGESFSRHAAGPILDRSPQDPYFCGTPWVLRQGVWKMWYSSGVEWQRSEAGLEPRYRIRQAESHDGLSWQASEIALELEGDEEGGLSRPAVLAAAEGWRMWYCRRGWRDYRSATPAAYRIHSATSEDGKNWTRDGGPAAVDVGTAGWDMEMTAYPAVVEAGGSHFMFYNGNGFGRSGIGIAVAE